MGTSGEATGPNLLPASDPGWGPWRGASGDSWPGTRSLPAGVRFTISLFRPALAWKIVVRPGPGKTQPRGASGGAGFLPTRVGGAAPGGACRGGIPIPGSEEEPRPDRNLCLLEFFFPKLDQSLV